MFQLRSYSFLDDKAKATISRSFFLRLSAPFAGSIPGSSQYRRVFKGCLEVPRTAADVTGLPAGWSVQGCAKGLMQLGWVEFQSAP